MLMEPTPENFKRLDEMGAAAKRTRLAIEAQKRPWWDDVCEDNMSLPKAAIFKDNGRMYRLRPASHSFKVK